MVWTENGPVSLPPRSTTHIVAGVIGLVALVGLGVGFGGAWRNGDRPSSFDAADQSQGADQAVAAQPIVTIPAVQQQAAASPTAANSAADTADETVDSNAIAARTAQAQAAQSHPANAQPNIDDLMTSRSEKPQAAAKPSSDEGAPPSDVPF